MSLICNECECLLTKAEETDASLCAQSQGEPLVPLPVDVAVRRSLQMLEEYRGRSAEASECTCCDCPANAVCDFAFDPYNTDGDCLAIK